MRASDAWLVYGTRHLEDVVALGAARERVVVAPLTALPPDRPIVARTAHGGPVRYLFVGRLIERKGVAALLEAFRHVRGGELWIAGDGPLRPLVDAASAADPRLRVLGHLEGDALSDLYASADVLVVPSLYEPWGLVVHEGLSHGLPVVTTHEVGAADDLIEDGANGALTPPGDVQALASAMNDVGGWTAERRERGAQRSVENLARCTLERAAAGFLHASALAVSHREVFPREHAP
jgi:glycosyltransferase involved in cell wall biosynthesis